MGSGCVSVCFMRFHYCFLSFFLALLCWWLNCSDSELYGNFRFAFRGMQTFTISRAVCTIIFSVCLFVFVS